MKVSSHLFLLQNLTKFEALDGAMKHDDISFFMLMGDNFYHGTTVPCTLALDCMDTMHEQ